MLGPFVVVRQLPHGRGRLCLDAHGMMCVQQGRPHSVIAVPGEVHLYPDDFKIIREMYKEWKRLGYKEPPPGTIIPY
jgi:hypothetical protein